jgi:glucuronide carrier protein
MMQHNRPLVLLCAATLLFLSGMFSLQTVAVYYARDVLGHADLYIVLTVVSTVGMVLASALVPKAVDTIGKKHAYLLAGGIAVASAVGFAVAPGSALVLGIVRYGVLGFGLGTINTLIFALQAPTSSAAVSGRAASGPKAAATPCSPSSARRARASAGPSPPA